MDAARLAVPLASVRPVLPYTKWVELVLMEGYFSLLAALSSDDSPPFVIPRVRSITEDTRFLSSVNDLQETKILEDERSNAHNGRYI